jgi:hypothetical protein
VGVGLGVGVVVDAARAVGVEVWSGAAEVHPASPSSAIALDATISPTIPLRMAPLPACSSSGSSRSAENGL